MRRASTPRAHSLVEVCIAAVVLALAILPIFGLFSSSGKQGKQTGDQGLSLALLEKTAEELRVAAWENPHAATALRENMDLQLERPVVDSQNPFFAVIEDAREPLGALQERSDPGITPEFATLHRSLSSHRLAYSAERAALTSGVATDLSLRASWTGFRQESQALGLTVRLPERQALAPALPLPERDAADALVAALIYPGKTGSLPGLAAAAGADLTVVRALGDVALLAQGFAEADAAHRETVAAAEAARGGDPVSAARAQVALARTHERRAAQALEILACLLEPLRVLADPGASARMGTPPPDPRRVTRPLLTLLTLPAAFSTSLGAARDAYAAATVPPYSTGILPRVRMRLLIKIVELLKLRALTSAPEDLLVLKDLLDRIREEQSGRNPNFAEYAQAESERCFDMATLQATYPRKEAERWREARTLTGAAVDAAIARLPAVAAEGGGGEQGR